MGEANIAALIFLAEESLKTSSAAADRAARPRGDIRPALALAGADLVDLVEEDDAIVLDLADRGLHDRLLVDQLVALLGQQRAIGILDQDAPGLALLAEGFAEHVRRG